jgi:hypothetical protein
MEHKLRVHPHTFWILLQPFHKDLTKLLKPLSIDLHMKVFKVKRHMLDHIKNYKNLLDLWKL